MVGSANKSSADSRTREARRRQPKRFEAVPPTPVCIAMSTGTDVPMNAARVTLMSGDRHCRSCQSTSAGAPASEVARTCSRRLPRTWRASRSRHLACSARCWQASPWTSGATAWRATRCYCAAGACARGDRVPRARVNYWRPTMSTAWLGLVCRSTLLLPPGARSATFPPACLRSSVLC